MSRQGVTGAILVAGIAIAAAIAIYESEQIRQFAGDVRRKIAQVFETYVDEQNNYRDEHRQSNDREPSHHQPRFNRPEDAEGFNVSQGHSNSEVEANEESERQQREELMYWNAKKIAQDEKERHSDKTTTSHSSSKADSDHLSQQSKDKGKMALVYSSGSKVTSIVKNNLRNRGLQNPDTDVNPFSDKHIIDVESQSKINSPLVKSQEVKSLDVISDIYNATDARSSGTAQTDHIKKAENRYPSNDAHAEEIFASIHAWAENARSDSTSNMSNRPKSTSPSPNKIHEITENEFETLSTGHDQEFYSSLSGDLTPTDSLSHVDPMEITGLQSRVQSGDESFDVMSLSGAPSSSGTWTEVGSIVSENDVI